jgi:hypothetical protein
MTVRRGLGVVPLSSTQAGIPSHAMALRVMAPDGVPRDPADSESVAGYGPAQLRLSCRTAGKRVNFPHLGTALSVVLGGAGVARRAAEGGARNQVRYHLRHGPRHRRRTGALFRLRQGVLPWLLSDSPPALWTRQCRAMRRDQAFIPSRLKPWIEARQQWRCRTCTSRWRASSA